MKIVYLSASTAGGVSVARVDHRQRPTALDYVANLGSKMLIALAITARLRPRLHKGRTDIWRGIQLASLTAPRLRRAHPHAAVVLADEIGVFHLVQRYSIRTTRPSLDLSWLKRSRWFQANLPDVLVLCQGDEQQRLLRRQQRNSRSDVLELSNVALRERLARTWPAFEEQIIQIATDLQETGSLTFVPMDMGEMAAALPMARRTILARVGALMDLDAVV